MIFSMYRLCPNCRKKIILKRSIFYRFFGGISCNSCDNLFHFKINYLIKFSIFIFAILPTVIQYNLGLIDPNKHSSDLDRVLSLESFLVYMFALFSLYVHIFFFTKLEIRNSK